MDFVGDSSCVFDSFTDHIGSVPSFLKTKTRGETFRNYNKTSPIKIHTLPSYSSVFDLSVFGDLEKDQWQEIMATCCKKRITELCKEVTHETQFLHWLNNLGFKKNTKVPKRKNQRATAIWLIHETTLEKRQSAYALIPSEIELRRAVAMEEYRQKMSQLMSDVPAICNGNMQQFMQFPGGPSMLALTNEQSMPRGSSISSAASSNGQMANTMMGMGLGGGAGFSGALSPEFGSLGGSGGTSGLVGGNGTSSKRPAGNATDTNNNDKDSQATPEGPPMSDDENKEGSKSVKKAKKSPASKANSKKKSDDANAADADKNTKATSSSSGKPRSG
ncbi:unnamed protein product [Amoebophrya sp. A25]|nr:unnamed protein product [Amoebophrya sp. A25]|eukprot:GSA25T00027759001.1